MVALIANRNKQIISINKIQGQEEMSNPNTRKLLDPPPTHFPETWIRGGGSLIHIVFKVFQTDGYKRRKIGGGGSAFSNYQISGNYLIKK